jgi:hypothetical protein
MFFLSRKPSAASTEPPWPASLNTDLVLFWPFNGDRKDGSGNGYDAEVYSGAVCYRVSIRGKAITGGGGIRNTLCPFPGTNPFTFSLWHYLGNIPQGSGWLMGWPPSSWGTFAGTFTAAVGSGAQVVCFPDTASQITTAESLNKNAWNHVAISGQGSALNVYINGIKEVFALSTSMNINGAADNGDGFVIGTPVFSGAFNPWDLTNLFDSVGYWSRILSDAEIAQLYNSGQGVEP